jgi:anti-sigma factor RsiW
MALAPLGRLRECLSAARNLEHLLASREVGPKALEQVVPEVAAELSPWNAAVGELCSILRTEFKLPSSALAALETEAQSRLQEFTRTLHDSSGAAMHARLRLDVERKLRATLPTLSATLAQLELLAQAGTPQILPMTLLELISDAPDLGSHRPHKPLLVSGPVNSPLLLLPAAAALGCLGILAGLLPATVDPLTPLQLLVAPREARVQLTFHREAHPVTARAKLPLFPPTAYSLETVAIVLDRYGGTLLTPPHSLILPATYQTEELSTKSQTG